jgi:ribonuclease D
MFDGQPKAPRKLADQVLEALHTPLPDENDLPPARGDDRDRSAYKKLQQAVAERSAELGLPDGVLASRRWIEALQDGEDWPGALSGWRRAQLETRLAPILASLPAATGGG